MCSLWQAARRQGCAAADKNPHDEAQLLVQAFEIALQQCGATADTSIFVDDSNRNVMAARQMGIFTIQVPQAWQLQQSARGSRLRRGAALVSAVQAAEQACSQFSTPCTSFTLCDGLHSDRTMTSNRQASGQSFP